MNDWQRDEWWIATSGLTDLERFLSIDEPRVAMGITGDKDDAHG